MEGEPIRLQTPLTDEALESLRSGDLVHLSGTIYTARDAAHERMCQALSQGESLPFDPKGQVVFYVGPAPARPGQAIGSAGPTTASRMDPYTAALIERGLKGMIGKGRRSGEVRKLMQENVCVYFGAIEGTAALISSRVKSAELIAYEDLGAEAIRRLEVEDLPLTVINDVLGGDLYDEGRKKYQRHYNA